MLTKVCEYQRFFSEIVIIDYSNSILYLDSISKGSLLPTMREMKKMKSIKVSNILLFYSENRVQSRIRCRGDFTILFILILAEKVEIMINNLILYFKQKYRDKGLLYFTNKAKEEVKDNILNKETKRIVYLTTNYLKEELKDNIGLDSTKEYIQTH